MASQREDGPHARATVGVEYHGQKRASSLKIEKIVTQSKGLRDITVDVSVVNKTVKVAGVWEEWI